MSIRFCERLSESATLLWSNLNARTLCAVAPVVAAYMAKGRLEAGAVALGEGVLGMGYLVMKGFTPAEVAQLPISLFKCLQAGECPSLDEAMKSEDIPLIKFLILRGADLNAIDQEGKKPLHRAAASGNVGVINALIELGASVYARAEDGRRPLHEAAINGHVAAIDTLVKHGAGFYYQDENGYTALELAVHRGHVNAILALVDAMDLSRRGVLESILHESNFQTGDKKGTLLHVATLRNQTKAIDTLIKYGANINAADQHGRTPLHVAANEDNVDVIFALLDQGADVNMIDVDGRTPFNLALQQMEHAACAALALGGAELPPNLKDDEFYEEIKDRLPEIEAVKLLRQLREFIIQEENNLLRN